MLDSTRAAARRLEPWLVALIALHSAAIGVVLTLAPTWAASFGGFGAPGPLFFPRQAGVFHFAIALGYLGEYAAYGSVRLLVTAKAVATIFLVSVWLGGETAWSVPFSAAADCLMGIAAATLSVAAGPRDRPARRA